MKALLAASVVIAALVKVFSRLCGGGYRCGSASSVFVITSISIRRYENCRL
jgi:hypothetical protein